MNKTKKIIIFLNVFVATLYFGCNASELGQSYDSLHKRIIIYNLINGLYLTKDQMNFILDKAKEINSFRKELKEKMEAEKKEQVGLLGELESEVKKEVPQPSSWLARSIHQNNIYTQKLRREYIEVLDRAAYQIKLILNPTQIYNIKTFKPCVIPPKGTARIGQSEEAKGLVRLLERIRKMSQSHYESRKDVIVERFIDRIYLKNPRIEQNEVSEAANELVAIMDRARSLSDTDFALEKKDLAKRIKSLTEPERESNLNRRIEKFLLAPETIYVLEDKLSSFGSAN